MTQGPASSSVHFRNLTKSFADGQGGRRSILKNCTHTFEAGKVHLIFGRSGSGKSTLLNLVAAIDQPDSGELSVGDTLITQASEKERTNFRRMNLGFVFQYFHLLPELTVYENCLLPLELTGKVSDARVQSWLGRLGLQERADDFPDVLSGGEQQRVGLIRALIHAPRILLADEPTGNLDQTNAELVMNLIREMCHETGATALVVSHDRGGKIYADHAWELTSSGLNEI